MPGGGGEEEEERAGIVWGACCVNIYGGQRADGAAKEVRGQVSGVVWRGIGVMRRRRACLSVWATCIHRTRPPKCDSLIKPKAYIAQQAPLGRC